MNDVSSSTFVKHKHGSKDRKGNPSNIKVEGLDSMMGGDESVSYMQSRIDTSRSKVEVKVAA